MVEKVMTEVRNIYKAYLNYDNVEIVLRELRKEMQVDPITKIEHKKMKLGVDGAGNSFMKMMAFL